MKSRLAKVTWFLLLYITVQSVAATEQTVEIIVHPEVSTTQLTPAQLRKIFSMRQTVWPNGQPIVVFVLDPQSDAHLTLCKEVLKMFPYQMERLWNKLAYSGLGDKPIELTSHQMMLQQIQQTPGAIGYVAGAVNIAGLKSVTVVGDK